MSNVQTVSIDAIRTLGEASILDTYVAVGTPLIHLVRMIYITNNTAGDMFFSVDGVTDQIFVPAGTSRPYDFNTNRTNRDQWFVLPTGTQFYVRFSTTPTSGAVYIECFWGQ
jgi:hypothetical protein